MNTQFYTFDMIGLESLFKYSSVYNTTLHPENLLISLDRKILIENLLYLLRSQPKFVNFIDFCNIYISSETDDIVLLKRVYNEIIESNINNLPYKIISYSNQTILNLLAISFSLPPSNNLQAECDDNFRLKIVKAILAENEKIDNDKKKYILAENLPEPLSTSYILAMNILPYDDFTNNNSNAKLITACIKAAKLFDFCYKTNTYIDLINTFLEKYKCKNYLKYLHNVLKLFFTSNDEQIIYITLDSKDVNYLSDLLMLRSLSISINQIISLEDNIDYVYFRNKPIIEIQENSFIIISRNLLADKIFNGIFFDLNVINQQQHIVKDFFIDYTTKFSEQYLFYSIIEKMISKHKYISFNGEDFRKSNIKGEPDYYIRNWNDIFLFEFKDSKINKEIKISSDYNSLKKTIEEKFVQKSNKRPSAIKQLVNNINRILNYDISLDTKYNNQKIKIYPVLVVGDSKFSIPGISCILNEYLKKELENNGITNDRIMDLIIVDIDTLILYQNDFCRKNLTLRNIIDEYYSYLKKHKPISNIKDNVIYNAFHKYFSFSYFLLQKKRKSKIDEMYDLCERFKIEGLEKGG